MASMRKIFILFLPFFYFFPFFIKQYPNILSFFYTGFHTQDSNLFAQSNDQNENPERGSQFDFLFSGNDPLLQNNPDNDLSLEPLPQDTQGSGLSFFDITNAERGRSLRSTEGEFSQGNIQYEYGNVKLGIFGRTNTTASYGQSFYLSEKDRLDDVTIANSKAIHRGFDLNMDLKVAIKGKIGERVSVNVDFDQNERQTQNTFQVQYSALKKNEFVQEVTIGNLDLQLPKTEFAVFEQKSKRAVGLQSRLESGKLKFKTVATLTQGQNHIDRFSGVNRSSSTILSEYQFAVQQYYQLEPFIYYGDGCQKNATFTPASYQRNSSSPMRTFTSISSNAQQFFPSQVDITSGSLEIWLDDRNARNDTQLGALTLNAISDRSNLSTITGNYHRLQPGKDYAFNNRTGRIRFIEPLRREYRVFVKYKRNGGTCDASAYSLGDNVETFLKWDRSIQEDSDFNGSQDIVVIDDQKLNLDIYEVRGIYALKAENILQMGFQISALTRNFQKINQFSSLGNFSMDYMSGIISFYLREPFKNLRNNDGSFALSNAAMNTIYTDRQPSFVGENSEVLLRADFTAEVRNYKLTHFNILQNSVTVRVNSQLIDRSQYFVDYNSGYFTFINPGNPVIGPNTQIEVAYEYSPYGTTNQGYILGLRSDYQASKYFKIGSSVLFNGQFEKNSAPKPGSEPINRLLLEGDMSMNLNEEKLTKFINTIPGIDFDLLNVKFSGYAEYAQSYYNTNTYGIALVDDMESSEDFIEVEISEKDWLLSSPPINPVSGVRFLQCDRSPLYYKYYRDPGNIQRGLMDFASGYRAAPEYSVLSGPYNVSEGHLDNSQLNLSQAERQVSLVLDFDFSKSGSSSPFAAVASRNFSQAGMDFSNIRYLEFNAKLLDAISLNSGVRIYFDVGTLWEDSDGDGVYDSEDYGLDNINGDTNANNIEDVNEYWDDGERNGVLDSERGGRNEDRGFAFSPIGCPTQHTIVGAGPNIPGFPVTRGNGVLDTEDADKDGFINKPTDENTVIIGDKTLPYIHFDKGQDNLVQSGDWTLYRIGINAEAMSDNQRKAWRQVKSIRLYVIPEAGSQTGKGKLLIDGIRFGGSKWRKVTATSTTGSSTSVSNPLEFSVATIDNFSSKEEYKNESFLLQERGTYEKIHGKKTNTEYARIKEAALKLQYDFSAATIPKRNISVRRIFYNAMDLRNYESITVWVNYRDVSPQSSFLFRVGSSDIDYFEFASKIDRTGWQPLTFYFSNPSQVSGRPNIKEINTLALGVGSNITSAKGVLWVNDIYVSNPKIQSDSAYKYETGFHITKPLYKTAAGTPILSDIKVLYRSRRKGRQFASVGQSVLNMDEARTEFISATKITPFWSATYNFSKVSTDSDDNEVYKNIKDIGTNRSIDHNTEHRFNFQNPYIPEIVAGYQYRETYNRRKSNVAETEEVLKDNPRKQNVTTFEKNHSPNLLVQEKLPEFLNTKINYSFKTGMRFFSKNQTFDTESAPAFGYAASIKNNLEKEQTEETVNTLQVNIGDFKIVPSYSFRQSVLVAKNFTDTITLEPFHGDFYTPFFSRPGDSRFRQRITRFELETSYSNLWIFSPTVGVSATYQENSFQDNQLTYKLKRYQSLKQPSSITTLRLSLPVKTEKAFPKIKILQSLVPGFTREIILNENAVPFTRNNSVYEDSLGLSRTLGRLVDDTFNIIKTPPWKNYLSTGRDHSNFSVGREYVANSRFLPSMEKGYEMAFQNYDNALTLRENFTLPAQWSFYSPLTLRTDMRLGQNASRTNLTSLPTQSVNWGGSLLQTWDLMQVFNFWFWESNSRHASTFDINYLYDRNMRITENLREDKHSPALALTFNWYDIANRLSSISFKGGLNLRVYDQESYMRLGVDHLDTLIYLTIPARSSLGIREEEIGYEASVEYRTELPWLKKQFQNLTTLVLRYSPRYTASLSANWNRYDYFLTQLLYRPTLDQFIFSQKLDINLHANVTGNLDLRGVWDVYRDPNTKVIRQEILSFQIGFGARILF